MPDPRVIARQRLSRERGYVRKDWGGRIPIALVYPNSYYIGMSNLGLQTVYSLFNAYPDFVCERAFVDPPRARQARPGAPAHDRLDGVAAPARRLRGARLHALLRVRLLPHGAGAEERQHPALGLAARRAPPARDRRRGLHADQPRRRRALPRCSHHRRGRGESSPRSPGPSRTASTAAATICSTSWPRIPGVYVPGAPRRSAPSSASGSMTSAPPRPTRRSSRRTPSSPT